MISIIQTGHYELSRLDASNKLLRLATVTYLWHIDKHTESLQLLLGEPQDEKRPMLSGTYRIYEIIGDSEFANSLRIELEYAPGIWIGYELTIATAMPSKPTEHVRIERTPTTITGFISASA